jgi:hypothetical protein
VSCCILILGTMISLDDLIVGLRRLLAKFLGKKKRKEEQVRAAAPASDASIVNRFLLLSLGD